MPFILRIILKEANDRLEKEFHPEGGQRKRSSMSHLTFIQKVLHAL
jgi:hypothetical protein